MITLTKPIERPLRQVAEHGLIAMQADSDLRELTRKGTQDLRFTSDLLPSLPPRLKPERQQDRAYDHHAFHEDAEPGDLGLQLGTPVLSSSK